MLAKTIYRWCSQTFRVRQFLHCDPNRQVDQSHTLKSSALLGQSYRARNYTVLSHHNALNHLLSEKPTTVSEVQSNVTRLAASTLNISRADSAETSESQVEGHCVVRWSLVSTQKIWSRRQRPEQMSRWMGMWAQRKLISVCFAALLSVNSRNRRTWEYRLTNPGLGNAPLAVSYFRSECYLIYMTRSWIRWQSVILVFGFRNIQFAKLRRSNMLVNSPSVKPNDVNVMHISQVALQHNITSTLLLFQYSFSS